MANSSEPATLLDLKPPQRVFLRDVQRGLAKRRKELPCKYFYDERGSQLFEQICHLDEYYLTRTELAVMQADAAEMAQCIGPRAALVEYGSGSSLKTRVLLDHLREPIAYLPVDISRKHLRKVAARIAHDYPHIDVRPVCADFTRTFELPWTDQRPLRTTVYFPGSTIGNFLPSQARELLRQIAALVGEGGGLLIGIDLQKEPHIIEAAYNDNQGVTAQFNLNLLHRINRDLDGDFDTDVFSHEAIYNDKLGRVEISLVSESEQSVRIADQIVPFDAGEKISTEFSHKYTIEGFAQLADSAGLTLRRVWTDDDNFFGVLFFESE